MFMHNIKKIKCHAVMKHILDIDMMMGFILINFKRLV